MFKHPSNKNNSTLIDPIDDKMIQPNTIDLRLNYVFEIEESNFYMSESSKNHRKRTQLQVDSDDNYHLKPGKCYEFISKQMVEIGADEMALVLGRSTFNRNGVLIVSSVYDSGFKDFVGATVYNIGGETVVQQNTRFAHLILASAEMVSKYAGSYGIK